MGGNETFSLTNTQYRNVPAQIKKHMFLSLLRIQVAVNVKEGFLMRRQCQSLAQHPTVHVKYNVNVNCTFK